MRYTPESVSGVLDLYWPLIEEPDEESILSRYYYKSPTSAKDSASDKETTRPMIETDFFFEHKRSVSVIPLLAHTYITYRDRVWHPGAPTNPIIDPVSEDELMYPLLTIRELCTYCARKFMENRFKSDSSFHIICNNCQIQFGLFGDTILVMITIMLLITNIYEPTLIKTLLLIYVCFILVLVNTTSISLDSLELYHCPHIKFGLGAKFKV